MSKAVRMHLLLQDEERTMMESLVGLRVVDTRDDEDGK